MNKNRGKESFFSTISFLQYSISVIPCFTI